MPLEIIDLTKNYSSIMALNQFTYSFQKGIYGILGANGAGKSTLLKLITDSLRPDKGSIRYNGETTTKMGNAFRGCFGYMPQQQGFFERMSGDAFLYYIAELKGMPKKQAHTQIPELIDAMHLKDKRHQPIATYSGGMKQRLQLAQALLGNPDVLILDEPTAGLDPNERIRIRNYLSSIAAGKIILIATHIVSDIEMIADQVLIMKQGQLVKAGNPDALMQSIQTKVADIIQEEYNQELSNVNPAFMRVVNVFRHEGCTYKRVVGDQLPKSAALIRPHITLEDVFHYYTMERCTNG